MRLDRLDARLLSIVQAPERLDDPRFKDELVRLVLGYLSPQT